MAKIKRDYFRLNEVNLFSITAWHLEPYKYDIHTERGARGFENCHVFADSIGFKK